MDNYVCVPVEHENEYLWCVFENNTEQVINSFYFEDEAKEYIKFLNDGGAFNGWTPAFVLNEITIQSEEDINKEFNSKLY